MQWETAATVEAAQRRSLVKLLDTTLRHVPMYRDFTELTTGLSTDNVTERLRQLPVIEKHVIQEKAAQLRVTTWRGRYATKTTGGSTGQPLTVWKDHEAIAQEMAASWLGYGWFGIEIGAPSIRFWGQPPRNLKRRLRYLAADKAMRRVTLSAFGYSRNDLGRYVARIRRFSPHYLYGYVSVIEDLANYLLESGDPLSLGCLRCVVTTSEVLSDPQRRTIQRAFGVPVQNEYGCGEVGPIAYECPLGSLHLLPSNHYVEILTPQGTSAELGQPGSIVITDLGNQVMPLLRYRIGDIGAFGHSCPCGRGLPVISTLYGREYDFVESPSGRRYHGEFFMYLFEDLRRPHPEIGQFQVTQTDATSVMVRVVVREGASVPDVAIREEFRKRLPELQATVLGVTHIPRRPSGKMRVVENRTEGHRRGLAGTSYD